MAVVNDKYRFIYLAEPYTASRSISHGLLQLEGSRSVGQHDSLDQLLARYDVDPTYFVFRFVRHPADWLVTHYHHQTSWHEKGFDDFVQNYLLDRVSVFWHHEGYVCHYEQLHHDLGLIAEITNSPAIRIPWIGVTHEKHAFREYYSPVLKDLLLSHLSDWETYGYHW